jgi:hypothetical protein
MPLNDQRLAEVFGLDVVEVKASSFQVTPHNDMFQALARAVGQRRQQTESAILP